ncbi:MAG: protein kinase domain-containing protein [Gammaproteobacteria bacterium]
MKIPGYRIERAIGEGGMATAYLAVQESLDRRAVLKVLKTSRQNAEENVERFRNEARIIASLNHPHIVTIYDIGLSEGCLFISMEYVEGGDLRARIKQTVSAEQGLNIIRKIGGGLAAAHQKGIVHRDVKPANILFRKDGEPLLTDFGIAKQLTLDHDLTSTGMFLGSPSYMAPEQSDESDIDGRADIYSLGIILFEMLTASKPYRAESVLDLLLLHKQGPLPQLPPNLSVLQPLLNLMLAKKRKDRFRDADSLLHYVAHLETKMKSPNLDPPALENSVPPVETTRSELTTTNRHYITHRAKAGGRRSLYLLVLLALSLGGNAALYYYDYRSNERALALQQAPAQAGFQPPPVPAERPTKLPPANLPSAQKSVNNEEVISALQWLARHSLEEYRLTHPPKDNAYYYYSRALAIDPTDPAAKKGLALVADRFAFLAERKIAENDYNTAQSYISIGLQIDPSNPTLRELNGLVASGRRNLFDTIIDFFRRR